MSQPAKRKRSFCRHIVDMRCYQRIPFPIPSLPSWEEELPTRPVSYHPAHRSIIDLAAICHRCDVNANVFCNNCTALRRIDIINTRPSGVGGVGGRGGYHSPTVSDLYEIKALQRFVRNSWRDSQRHLVNTAAFMRQYENDFR